MMMHRDGEKGTCSRFADFGMRDFYLALQYLQESSIWALLQRVDFVQVTHDGFQLSPWEQRAFDSEEYRISSAVKSASFYRPGCLPTGSGVTPTPRSPLWVAKNCKAWRGAVARNPKGFSCLNTGSKGVDQIGQVLRTATLAQVVAALLYCLVHEDAKFVFYI